MLAENLASMGFFPETWAVIGMLADKGCGRRGDPSPAGSRGPLGCCLPGCAGCPSPSGGGYPVSVVWRVTSSEVRFGTGRVQGWP